MAGFLGKDALGRAEAATVGIAGAGGLGSNCAAMFVRSGFRRLVIADNDRVEASNLNRQFYFMDQVGRPKVEALAENLLRIRPGLELRLEAVRVSAENAADIFADCTVVVEAFDLAETKGMLASALLPLGKKVVCASGLAGWGGGDLIRTEKRLKNLVIVGDQKRGVSPGSPPLAPRVTIAAAKQADCVLEMVLGPFGRDADEDGP